MVGPGKRRVACATDWPIGGSAWSWWADWVRRGCPVGVDGTLDKVHESGHAPVISPRGNFLTAYFRPKEHGCYRSLMVVAKLFNKARHSISPHFQFYLLICY